MNKFVERPEATGSKINCYDEFELCYLRHQYFRKALINPSEGAMKPFNSIINLCAKRTYYTYLGLFKQVGLEWEDIVSIGKSHLVSYLGLFSVQFVDEKKDRFIDRFYSNKGLIPLDKDFLDKDKADFTSFLKQRMEDLVRISRQKVRNIRGQLAEEYLVFYGNGLPPDASHDLIKDYNKLGFKKLDVSKFKTLKKRFKNQEEGPVYKINDKFYITIPLDHRKLTVNDFIGAGINPYESIHNKNPEEIMLQNATEEEFQKKRRKWRALPKDEKNKQIRDFISAKQNDPRYTEEVKIARRKLGKLEE